MKTKKIPTVFVLNLYSWAVAALGVFAGVYGILFKANGHESLVSGLLIILGSSLCSVLIRVFGSLAQMMFDQGQIMEEIHQKFSWLDEIRQKLVALDRLEEIKQKLNPLEEIHQKFSWLDEIRQKLVALDRLEEIKQKLNPLEEIKLKLGQLEEIKQKLGQLEEIKLRLIPLDQMEEVNRKLDQMEEINRKLDPMDTLNQTSEKISCDSKDMSQGIHQIKEFFERIEKHLDLHK